jgi:ribosome-binding protein aMBF1 (putative translation factor)
MERPTRSSDSRNFQAPTGEMTVVPKPYARSGEFVLPSQQSGRERAQRRRGGQQKPPERTSAGDLYVGSLIRVLREDKGLSLSEAAAQLGYQRSKLSMLETNTSKLSAKKRREIAELLGVPVTELEKAPVHPRVSVRYKRDRRLKR